MSLFIVILETPSTPSTDIFLSVFACIVLAFITSVISKPVVSLIDSIVFASTDSSNGSGVGQMGGYVPSVLAKTIELSVLSIIVTLSML